MKTIKSQTYSIFFSVFLTLILFSFSASGQELSQAYSFGGSLSEMVFDVEVGSDGSIYTIGSFQGTVDFDPGSGTTALTAVGARAIFLTKSSASGALIWAKQFGGGAAEFGSSTGTPTGKIALDASGNIYVGGYFYYDADFNPGTGTNTLNVKTSGYSDIFFSKLDANGNLIWVKQIGGERDDAINDIALDASGDIFITGYFRNNLDFDPDAGFNVLAATGTAAFIGKYSGSTGAIIWCSRMALGSNANVPIVAGNALAVAPGYVYVGGYYLSSNSRKGYIAKFTHAGGLTLDHEYTGSGQATINALTLNSDYDLFATGYFSGAIEGMTAKGSNDVLVSQIFNNGAKLWTKQIGGTSSDRGLDIAVGKSREIYVIGTSFSSPIDLDPGEDILNYEGNSFITSMDEDGNFFRSARAFEFGNSPGPISPFNYSGFNAIAVKGEDIFLGGVFSSSVDLDPSTGESIQTSQGGTDVFVAKYTQEPQTFTIDENTANGTLITTLSTSIGNFGVEISAGNTDNAFSIASNLRLTVNNKAALDFEQNPSFTLEITITDQTFCFCTPESEVQKIRINLRDLDETPSIADQSFSIISTISNGDTIGTLQASDPNDLTLTFSIDSGNDSGIFGVDASTGVLTMVDKSSIDFAIASTIDLTVSASNGTEVSTATVDITVDLPPAFNFTVNTYSFDENFGFYISIPITDPENEVVQVSFQTIAGPSLDLLGDGINEAWGVTPGQEGLDYEEFPTLEFVLRGTDPAGNVTISDTITVNINNLNDNAPNIQDTTLHIMERLPNGSAVTTVVGEDLDNDTLTYAIVSGNTGGAFVMEASSGVLTVNDEDALVFAVNPTFDLVVSVSDGENQAEATITINLIESLAPRIANQSFTIIELIENGDEVGIIKAVDSQDDPITFSILSGNTDSAFLLNDTTGALTVANRNVLDFSAPNSYQLTISASDGTDDNSAEITVILNAAPIYDFQNTSFSFDENTQWPLLIPITDPEGDELTVTIETGNTDGVLNLENTANSSNGMTVVDAWEIFPSTSAGIDFEKHQKFDLVLRAEDAFGNITLSSTITININNLNDNAPTLADTTVSVSEGQANGTLVTKMSAIDLDNSLLTYSLLSGNTGDAFALASTGELTVANTDAIVFATKPTYSLAISVTDGAFTSQGVLTVDVEEASAPDIVNQTFNIISSIAQGDLVGTVQASDAQGDPITYTIESGNTSDAFALNQATGELTVSDRSVLDFTTPNFYSLNVSVSDGTDANTATVTIVMNNAPVYSWSTTSFSFDENKVWALSVPVSDPESDVLTVTITSGNGDNLLTLVNTAAAGQPPVYSISPIEGIDFETGKTSFTLNLNAMDAVGNETASEAITININNLNDNAPVADDQSTNINQNLPNGIKVATVVGSDADGDDFTFNIKSGNTDNAFSIESITGEITVANSSALVFTTNPVFKLEVEISDDSLSSVAMVTINLNETNVNTVPLMEDQTFEIAENSEDGTEVGEIVAIDLEGDALTFTIVGGNTGNAFFLTSTGKLLVADGSQLDFEVKPTYGIIVSVSDGLLTEAATVTVALTDVNEIVLSSQKVEELSIYPNPASQYFKISGIAKNATIDLIDISGKLIRNFENADQDVFEIKDLNKGVYTVHIKWEGNILIKKLVIK